MRPDRKTANTIAPLHNGEHRRSALVAMLSLVFDLVQANHTVMLGVLALLMTINMGILLGVVREPRGAKGEFKTGLPQTFGALPPLPYPSPREWC